MKLRLRQKRFTLTETLVAAALCAVVFATAATLFGVYRRAQVMMVRRATAFAIAGSRLEDLSRTLDYSQPTAANEDETEVDEKGDALAAGWNNLYLRSTVVTPLAEDWHGDGSPDVCLVQVTVSYPRFLTGTRATASLSTYLAKPSVIQQTVTSP